MSTYYYFGCDNCREYGGFYSSQAWGWGNFDIIASFRFLAHHTGHCGPGHLRIVREQNREWDEWTHVVPATNEHVYDDLGEKRDYYDVNLWPRSNDWDKPAHEAYRRALEEHANAGESTGGT